jgi:hypothetical protein
LSLLRSGQKAKVEALRRLKESDVESLIKTCSEEPFIKRSAPWGDEYDDEEELDNRCCPFHCYTTFDAWKDDWVQDTYKKCWEYTRRKLFGAPLLMLNQDLVVNESNIKIVGDKMFFLNDSSLPPINFAACWNGAEPEGFIDIDQEISAPQLLIPPIMLHEFDEGYHLVLDFFRNDWMVQVDDEHTIPVPVITNEDIEEAAFLNRVDPDFSLSSDDN